MGSVPATTILQSKLPQKNQGKEAHNAAVDPSLIQQMMAMQPAMMGMGMRPPMNPMMANPMLAAQMAAAQQKQAANKHNPSQNASNSNSNANSNTNSNSNTNQSNTPANAPQSQNNAPKRVSRFRDA